MHSWAMQWWASCCGDNVLTAHCGRRPCCAVLPPQVYQRAQLGPGKEEYRLIGSFEEEPKAPQITQCFRDADN